MKIIGIPVGDKVHVHKAGCRDIGTYTGNGLTYDDCAHGEANTRGDVESLLGRTDGIEYFPCVKGVK
jgi:hypothetical protein